MIYVLVARYADSRIPIAAFDTEDEATAASQIGNEPDVAMSFAADVWERMTGDRTFSGYIHRMEIWPVYDKHDLFFALVRRAANKTKLAKGDPRLAAADLIRNSVKGGAV